MLRLNNVLYITLTACHAASTVVVRIEEPEHTAAAAHIALEVSTEEGVSIAMEERIEHTAAAHTEQVGAHHV